jgi:hypothetical protein
MAKQEEGLTLYLNNNSGKIVLSKSLEDVDDEGEMLDP